MQDGPGLGWTLVVAGLTWVLRFRIRVLMGVAFRGWVGSCSGFERVELEGVGGLRLRVQGEGGFRLRVEGEFKLRVQQPRW